MKRNFLILLLIPFLMGAASRSFDGIDDTIDWTAPSGLAIGTDSFTASCWIFWTNGADADETVMQQLDGTGIGRGWILVEDGSACTIVTINSFLGNGNTCGTTTVAESTWYHFFVRSDEGAGNVEVGINGTEEGQTVKTIDAATGNIRLGRHKTNTTTDYEGLLSYCQILEGVVTDAQIKTLMWQPDMAAAFGNPLQSYHPLWGDSTEQDLSGNNNDGTVTGATTNAGGPPVFLAGGLPL